jgi:hypothetical protein
LVRVAGWEWIALVGLLLAALLLRLYALGSVPPVVIHDEGDNLVNVYQILAGRGPGFFGLDWKPMPAAGVYLQSLFVGQSMSVFALRLPTALFSTAALIPFFLLLRREVSAVPAWLTTMLLATDTWYLHFSRTGWENVWVCLPFLSAAVCADRAVRTGSVRSFVWTGVWSAVGAYGYFSGRAILPTMLTVFAGAWIMRRAPRHRLAAGALLALLVALVLVAPQIKTATDQWEHFMMRPRHLSVFGPLKAEKSVPQKVWLVGRNVVRKSYELFNGRIFAGDYEARYLPIERGALPRMTALLALAGLAISLRRSSPVRWWWVLFVVPFFLSEALVRHKHLNGARALIVLPVVYLFVGWGMQSLWHWAGERWPRMALPVALSLSAILATSSSRFYFDWAQSANLRQALAPAIPVESFAAWQEDQLRRISGGHPVNLESWARELKQSQPTAAP